MSTTTEQSNVTIEGTVEQVLTARSLGSYRSQAQPVIDALVTREQALSKALIDQASEVDLSENEVRSILAGIGMHVAEPEAEEADDDDEWTDEKITAAHKAITDRLDNLERIARSHGLR